MVGIKYNISGSFFYKIENLDDSQVKCSLKTLFVLHVRPARFAFRFLIAIKYVFYGNIQNSITTDFDFINKARFGPFCILFIFFFGEVNDDL